MSRFACLATALAMVSAPALAQTAAPATPPAVPAAAPALQPAPEAPSATAPAPQPAPLPAPVAAEPAPVQVAPLAAPDAFSTPGRDTGLPPTLWRGASVATLRAVLPLLAQRPLSPAAAALGRRVLATGASGPKGSGADPALLAGRANALRALGDPKAAAAILARASGLENSADLSRAAAETALLAGDNARACAVAQALSVGRDEVYWLRLRTFCQALAGQPGQAQLTFDLAEAKAKDPVFARLMGAKLAGAGAPGAPSLRNGLDYALSRDLGLDLSAAKASPDIAGVLAGTDPGEPTWTPAAGDDPAAVAARALAAGGALPTGLVASLLDVAEHAEAKARPRAEAAALLVWAFATTSDPAIAARIAALGLPEARSPAGRNLVLQAAAAEKRMGETAMLALWTCAEAGAGGPAPAERARIVRALSQAGLEADARNFALEGLVAAP